MTLMVATCNTMRLVWYSHNVSDKPFFLTQYNRAMRQALDIYDAIPAAQKAYIRANGWHFTRKACEYAMKHMYKRNSGSNKPERIDPVTMDQYKEIMTKYGIKVDNDIMCDGLYVINMGKAKYHKSSIPDEQHLAMFVKDTLDDVDGADGNVMRCWYAKMVGSGIPVDWEEIL